MELQLTGFWLRKGLGRQDEMYFGTGLSLLFGAVNAPGPE